MTRSDNLMSNFSLRSIMITLFGWSIIIFLAIQALNPYFAERNFRDGFNTLSVSQTDLAIQYLERATNQAPWETHYQLHLGRAYEQAITKSNTNELKYAFIEKAEKNYLNMIALDDKNPWYKNRLANIYNQKAELVRLMNPPDIDAIENEIDSYESLVESYTRAAAKNDHQNPLFQLNLAFYLHKTMKIDEAISLYKTVQKMDLNMIEASFNLADIYRNRQDFEQTLESYLIVKKVDPNFANIDIAIASTYIQMKRLKDAVPYLQNVIQKEPANFDALKNLAAIHTQQANMAPSIEKWKKAANYYKTFLQLYPNEETMYEFYIQSLYNSNQLDAAFSTLESSMKQFPANTNLIELKNKMEKM